MSTYYVFGMTEGSAKEIAYKDALKDNVPPNQLAESIAERAERILNGTRVVSLGGPFDAPNFAREYVALAQKTQRARDLHIKARNQTGEFKNGRPVLEWVEVPLNP